MKGGGDMTEQEECTFDEYRCKGCDFYSTCLNNELCADAEWEMQQQFLKGELKWISTDPKPIEENQHK